MHGLQPVVGVLSLDGDVQGRWDRLEAALLRLPAAAHAPSGGLPLEGPRRHFHRRHSRLPRRVEAATEADRAAVAQGPGVRPLLSRRPGQQGAAFVQNCQIRPTASFRRESSCGAGKPR